jgi:serine protease inhibitor
MPLRWKARHAETSWETIFMHTVRSFIAARAAGLGALMLVSASGAFPVAAQAALAGETRDLAESMNKLGGALLGSIAGSRSNETVVVSPYGLGSALHLLSFGAGDRAQQTLRTKLLPPGFRAVQHVEGLIALKRQILGASRDKLKLTVASAVFIPEGAKPWSQFVGTALGVFDATPEVLNFADKAAVARINAWAKQASQGMIPRLVEQLDADTRFVLANVVYFNGAWETAFEAARTAKAPFTRVDGSKREVAMMDATIPVEFAEFDNLRAVWLPYDGKEVAMFIVAPGDQQGPTAVADALKRKSLGELMADALNKQRTAALQIRLPRFRVESKLDVTSALSGLGLGAAFAARANYNAINKAGGGPLQVTHRAVLEVTESGTKAAAATAITSDRSLATKPSFAADRPFAVAIVHRPTGAILFAGYIADPGDDPGPASAEPRAVR